MSLSENIDPLLPGRAESDRGEDDTAGGLFFGDSGELALDTRRALVQLLVGPSLDARHHTILWPVLLKDEEIIRRRLADLFLELVIDRDQQVAFTRQADTGDIKVPLLLRRSRLTFIDSVLLLHLRQLLTQAESRGERAVVSRDELVEHLGMYERSGNTDRAGFIRRLYNSIDKFKDRSILWKIRSSEDRYEVSPTLKLLFQADEIKSLGELYQRMAANETSEEESSDTSADVPGDEGEDE